MRELIEQNSLSSTVLIRKLKLILYELSFSKFTDEEIQSVSRPVKCFAV